MKKPSLNETREDTPANRRAFETDLWALLALEEELVALQEQPGKYPPVLLVALNGKLGLVRPFECHHAAFVICQMAFGAIEVFNCPLSKTVPIR